MREIKFRAWAEKTNDNVWDYAYPLAKAEAKESIDEVDEHELLFKYSKQWKENNPDADEYTKTKEMITNITVNGGKVIRPYGYEILGVMQYTGLKDKNGVEIYFGDKLRIVDKVGMEFTLNDWLDDCNLLLAIESGIYKVEIIGNIYENPELIK